MRIIPRTTIHQRLLAGMAVGVVAGFALHAARDQWPDAVAQIVNVCDVIGKDIFIGALKMIVAPLIFASIITGISGLPSARELGTVGVKTVLFYAVTTIIAVTVGVSFMWLISPGERAGSLDLRERRSQEIEQARLEFEREAQLAPGDQEYDSRFRAYLLGHSGDTSDATLRRLEQAGEITTGQMLREQLLLPLIDNPFHALSQSPPNTLGIIFFAIVLGAACLVLGSAAAPVTAFFRAGNDIMLLIAKWVMEIGPVAIACLIASLLATLGFDALRALAWFVVCVIGGLAAHVLVLLLIVRVVGGMSPLRFLRGLREPMLVSFTTASSMATLPVSLRALKERLGVHPRVCDFTLPVGATVNMDGTALYEAVALLFLVQLYGGLADVPIFFDGGMTFIIAFMAAVTAIGVAGIPSASLISLVLIANMVGLPLHYIVLIYATDHLLDMFRTTVNITGDAAGAVVIDRLERHRLPPIETSSH